MFRLEAGAVSDSATAPPLAPAAPVAGPAGGILNDPFVKRVLAALLVVAILAQIVPVASVLFAYSDVVWSGTWFQSPATRGLISFYRGLSGVPSDIVGPLLQSVPALIAALCFAQGRSVLSLLGRIVFLLVVVLIALAVVAVASVDPNSPDQIENFSGGVETVLLFQDMSDAALHAGLVYFGLLTGLTLATSRSPVSDPAKDKDTAAGKLEPEEEGVDKDASNGEKDESDLETDDPEREHKNLAEGANG